MSLLSNLISSPWFWVDVGLSVTGGLVVFWGLVIEKRAEKLLPPEDFKDRDIFSDIVKTQKAELERGWRILMIGIAFEVVAALGISIISGIEIAESKERVKILENSNLLLRTNVAGLELQVDKLKPEKQPIASISASTRVLLNMRLTRKETDQTRMALS